jgi:hypothetical protein
LITIHADTALVGGVFFVPGAPGRVRLLAPILLRLRPKAAITCHFYDMQREIQEPNAICRAASYELLP